MLFPIENSTFRSNGEAAWYGAMSELDTTASITGTHGVYGPQSFETPISVTGKYYGDLEGPAQSLACYGTRMEVRANRGLWGSTTATIEGKDTRCAPPPPRTTPPPESGDSQDLPCLRENGCSPIVISFTGRFEFTGVQDGVRFDIDADGRPDQVAWPRDGSIAFLFYDRNGNGRPGRWE